MVAELPKKQSLAVQAGSGAVAGQLGRFASLLRSRTFQTCSKIDEPMHS